MDFWKVLASPGAPSKPGSPTCASWPKRYTPPNPALRSNHEQLALLKLPKDDSGGQTRERIALAPDAVHDALRFWPDDTHMGRRNRALLAVLFYTGLRWFEAIALKWRDIDRSPLD